MESKDNRSKNKRNKMKQHFFNKNVRRTSNQTSSSSAPEPALKSVVDIADSSDDPYNKNWKPNPVYEQRNRDLLDGPHYEDNSDEENAGGASDFDVLTQTGVSHGHFQFANEKKWEKAEKEPLLERLIPGRYFRLNPKHISIGLLTVPFYKRMEYPSDIFTRKQLITMEKEAETAEPIHRTAMSETQLNVVRQSLRASSAMMRKKETEPKAKSAANSLIEDVDPELDELLNMCGGSSIKDVEKNDKKEATTAPLQKEHKILETIKTEIPPLQVHLTRQEEDIQQWLDSVLDE